MEGIMVGDQNLTCNDEERRNALFGHPTLNGIDYIEVSADQKSLHVYLINRPKPTEIKSRIPSRLVGHSEQFEIKGGTRIRNIQIVDVQVVDVTTPAEHLVVKVDKPGDFSTYTLIIRSQDLDPVYARCDFSFKVDCPSDFDCKPKTAQLPKVLEEPLIDYMAKDYASFRQALIDLIPTLVPEWKERLEADLGIALVELLAYAGDQLSYYQDAVANEAYLETARQRISVRRHARLIDYRMHDGASARTFIHLSLTAGTSGTLPAGTQVLSRIRVPLGPNLPGAVISASQKDEALKVTDTVFETMAEVKLDSRLNQISIYTWGNQECCLPEGATTVDLLGDLRTVLHEGDFLLFEEVVGPKTGSVADADPNHRQVVRLTKVESTRDPLMGIDLTRIAWGSADALTFPLCVSVRRSDGRHQEVSVARGNLVLADHGKKVTEWHPGEKSNPKVAGIELGERAYRFQLREGPLSFRVPSPLKKGGLTPVKTLLTTDPHTTAPQINLDVHTETEVIRDWEAVKDLLDSDAFDNDFVVETDNEGRALVRFGHDTYGAVPPNGAKIEATYRIGVGRVGNVGAESLVHVINPGNAPHWPDITSVRNPLPAWGGIAPESMEQVKQLAPAAFHAEQFRAVTEADYVQKAEEHPEVRKAVANFRWTGSWHTVFIAIDPAGQTELSPELEDRIRTWVNGYTLAGYDIEIQPPIFVPLEIDIDVCVKLTHFRADVKEAVLTAFSNQPLPNGSRGFFHPDNFTFDQPVYLSKLYAAIEAVEGVDSAVVTTFKRLREPETATQTHIAQAHIPIGHLEIARLDNDPSFPENGILRLNMLGGK
jgi:hypothetical protein